jgi:CTP synthase
VRAGYADQAHLQIARSARRGRPRRHDAPGHLRACELAGRWLTVYGATVINERHRHRYEFNCLYERTLVEHGLRISGRSPDGKFVEIAELPGHPWYLAVQFHPEFKSKPTRPHPLFAAFVDAAYAHKTAGVQRPATESVA